MNTDRKVKLIIAGGRDFTGYQQLRDAFAEFMERYENHEVAIICGMARGADLLGKRIAVLYDLPVIEMPANWDTYGKAAGMIRNGEMAKIGSHLLLAWDGKSHGSANMLAQAQINNLEIKIVYY